MLPRGLFTSSLCFPCCFFLASDWWLSLTPPLLFPTFSLPGKIVLSHRPVSSLVTMRMTMYSQWTEGLFHSNCAAVQLCSRTQSGFDVVADELMLQAYGALPQACFFCPHRSQMCPFQRCPHTFPHLPPKVISPSSPLFRTFSVCLFYDMNCVRIMCVDVSSPGPDYALASSTQKVLNTLLF